MSHDVSRRSFFGGLAAALGYLGLGPSTDLFAQTRPGAAGNAVPRMRGNDDYDAIAHLSSNENCWGPPESVMKAMNNAWKYSNRYGYPDANIVGEIAKHHGVKPENILLGAGSGEILDVVGTTFLLGGKKVLGVEPSYGSVYQHATSIKSSAITLPLGKDYRQDIPAMIKAANSHASELGFVYLCNPNNPTGIIITKQEVKQLLDGIPKDMPVLIDEAYHHFVDSPDYESSMKYVLEGRPVIVCRTFSKIAALAAMRLGYGVGPAELIRKVHTFTTGSQSITVKFGGAASLKDTAGQAKTRALNKQIRDDTIAKLKAFGYEVLPSEANFFMVGLKREAGDVAPEFQKRDVMVGRPFPPMTQHLRVSVGTQAEMDKFVAAFKDIMAAPAKSSVGA